MSPAPSPDYEKLGFAEMRELLKDIRANPVRKSALVYYCGRKLLQDKRRLGDEVWAILEQVFLAALDCNQVDQAERYFYQLRSKFGDRSQRVERLEGMLHEARGEYQEAIDIYGEILRSNPCHKAARRRLIAVCRAQGKREEALQLLHDYLQLHHADEEAQYEIADIALGLCDYRRAGAAFEDLLLVDPHQPVYMCKYAEVLYTQAGVDNLRLARKYFAQSIRLNPQTNNLRAIYGLWATCQALASLHGLRNNAENIEVLRWATEKLTKVYTPVRSQPFAAAVLRMLAANRLEG
eukprot:TRINITY_DN3336_c0_g1_i1.p1 TRINITY_DN3336_c0_g1~~TRINITY_DN3336_c0_g1_i1.p1  ORF type:complete len:294 (-),score=48.72 TRINITY_DN3336_c0_g1_i1:87-968(-)